MKRALVALSLLAAAVGLAGCGASTLVDPVASAASKSQSAGGVKVSMRVEVTSPALGQTAITGNGQFDKDQGRLTIDLSDVVQRLAVPIGSGSGVDVIYATEDSDPVVYVRFPFLANTLPGGKEWIRVDLQRAGNAAGIDLSKVLGQAGANPVDVLALLRASGDVTKAGSEEVDGVATTHYHATVDLEKALTTKGVPQETVQRLLDAGAPNEFPVDVWIGDDDGLVRKVQSSFEVPSGGESVKTVTTVNLSDWGSPVSVETPPGDQVFAAN
jgi:hypothetical protein